MTVGTIEPATTFETGHPRRWGILAVMCLSIFMLTIDNTIVNTALPAIARDLRASTVQMQWTVDGYVLALAGLLLVGGTIGDVFGRRRWFAVGMGIFGVASVGAALSETAQQLIAFRAMQGVGGALVMPATLSIITNAFPRHERAKAIGAWTGVGALAMGMGPALGGLLVDHSGWASIFWVHVPVVLAALLGLAIVPESRDSRPRNLDIVGATLGTIALTALVYGIIACGEHGFADTGVLLALGVATVTSLAFVLAESRATSPMLPLHFFRRRDFTSGVLIVGVVFFAVAVVFFFLTQYYQLIHGRTAFQAGLLSIPSAGAMMVGAPLSGMLVHRVGPRLLITTAVGFVAVAVALLSQLTAETSTLQIVGTMALFGLAGGIGMAPLTDMVMAAVPVEDAGVGSALNDVSRELGAALGIAGVGSVVSSLYRGEVEASLSGTVPQPLVESLTDGIGVATVVAETLPVELQTTVITATQGAFVEAFTTGLLVSAALLAVTTVVALVLVPRHSRAEQGAEPVADDVSSAMTAERELRVA